jgi:outer membrane protein assembly factor BamB
MKGKMHLRRPAAFCILLPIAWSLTIARAGAQDWPQFRGPTGQGISAATNVPVKWSPATNIAWKAEIPGQGWSSPVLSGGKVYLTSAITSPPSLRAICLNAATGKVLWDAEVLRPEPVAIKVRHQKNSPASATPVVTADRLYVHFGHMGTASLDLSGNVLWRQTGLKYPPVHGNGGSPALAPAADGPILTFSCDGARDPFVVALDAATGQPRWKTPRDTPARRTFSFSTPLYVEIDGAPQLVIPGSGLVGAYEPSTGRELWRVRYGEGYSVIPRPVFAAELGMLFVSSGFDAPVLYAIRPSGATGDATNTAVAWTTRKDAPKTPSMLVTGGLLFYASDNGTATCADAATGKVHWSHRFGGGFSASPLLAEGRVYFQNEAGVGYIVRADKAFQLLAENDLGERSLASYAADDGALYIRTETHLWKIAVPGK